MAWRCVYTLDAARRPLSGSAADLAAAVGRAADLRIYTEFRHDEHIEPGSPCRELVREVSDFRVTYLVERAWTAGIMSLRQPVALPDGFGPRPSMSFFLYNQDGTQAVARPHLDGLGTQTWPTFADMPRFHLDGYHDPETAAPSYNFVYDFDTYGFHVCDDWREVLHHSDTGEVISGSIDALAGAFARGYDVKVGIDGLCLDLGGGAEHMVFVQTGPGYYYTDRKLFIAETHPVVRARPAVPMRYGSRAWDFGWLIVRTDGKVARLLVDPYTLRFVRSEARHPVRWFVK